MTTSYTISASLSTLSLYRLRFGYAFDVIPEVAGIAPELFILGHADLGELFDDVKPPLKLGISLRE